MITRENRTKLQVEANEFDLKLSRLENEAMSQADILTPANQKHWRAVARYLRSARYDVRQMMHPDDREATAG